MVKVLRITGPGMAKLKALTQSQNEVGKVGWFESAKYEDGTPVAYVAAIQEFGSPERSIPPRPFMRPTIQEKQNSWQSLAASGAKAIIAGTQTISSVLDALGQRAAGDIRRTISKITSPALAMSTLRARASRKKTTIGAVSRKPLVDTGTMIQSLTSTVEPK